MKTAKQKLTFEQVDTLVNMCLLVTATFYRTIYECEEYISPEILIDLAVKLKPHIIETFTKQMDEEESEIMVQSGTIN